MSLGRRAEHREAVNDFSPPVEKETEGRTATLKGKVGDCPTIRLTASRGSVSVRKEGTLPSEIPPPAGKSDKAPKKAKDSEIIL